MITQPTACEHMTFRGQVADDDFLNWIAHRAKRLGLSGWARRADDRKTIEAVVQGPPDLIDAMALSCSLGPMTVWVDRVDRRLLATPSEAPSGFEIRVGR